MSKSADKLAAPEGRRIVGPRFLAEIFGVSEKTIRNWVADGMPQAGHGKYDLRACVQWKVDQVATASIDDEAEGATDSARRELYIAQRHKIELEIAERRGELLPAALVDQTLASVASVATSQIDALGPRLAGELADMDDPAAIQARLFTEGRQVRAAIAEQIRQMAEVLAEGEQDDPDDDIEPDNVD